MKKIVKSVKEVGVLVWQGLYLGGIFVFCQLCGLVILGPKEFLKKGPIN